MIGVPATSAHGVTATMMTAAAATSQSSCRRTTSEPARYRTTRHATPTSTDNTQRTSLTVHSQARESYAALAQGQVRRRAGPGGCSGPSPTSSTNSGAVTATAIATGRQRRDARRPSGSSSSEIGIRAMLIGHAHWNTVATSRTTHAAGTAVVEQLGQRRGQRRGRLTSAADGVHPPESRRRPMPRDQRATQPEADADEDVADDERLERVGEGPADRPHAHDRAGRGENRRRGPAHRRATCCASDTSCGLGRRYRRAPGRRPGNLPDRPGDLLDRSGTILCSSGLARRTVAGYQPPLEGIRTMTNTSGTTGRRIGLVILGLLSLGDIATLAPHGRRDTAVRRRGGRGCARPRRRSCSSSRPTATRANRFAS